MAPVVQIGQRVEVGQGPDDQHLTAGDAKGVGQIVGRLDALQQRGLRDEEGLQRCQGEERGPAGQPQVGLGQRSPAPLPQEVADQQHAAQQQAVEAHGGGSADENAAEDVSAFVRVLKGDQQGGESGQAHQGEESVHGVEVGELDSQGGAGGQEGAQSGDPFVEKARTQPPDQHQGETGDQDRQSAGDVVDLAGDGRIGEHFGAPRRQGGEEGKGAAQQIEREHAVDGERGLQRIPQRQGGVDQSALVGMEGVKFGPEVGAGPLGQNKVAGTPVEAGGAGVRSQRQNKSEEEEVSSPICIALYEVFRRGQEFSRRVSTKIDAGACCACVPLS